MTEQEKRMGKCLRGLLKRIERIDNYMFDMKDDMSLSEMNDFTYAKGAAIVGLETIRYIITGICDDDIQDFIFPKEPKNDR